MVTAAAWSCKSPPDAHIVVIGGGLMGSASAWHLSQQNQEVILLEQQEQDYTFGSSFGQARITRSLGPPGDMWSYLHNRSVGEALKLINYLNEADTQNHSMDEIYTTSPVTYLRHLKQLDRIRQLLVDQQDPYKFAQTPDSARELFNITIPDTAIILREFKQYSGTLNPQALISKLHQAIKLQGNQIWYGHKLDELKRVGDHFELIITHSSTGETKAIRCKKVVSAAGPYSGQVLQYVAPYFQQLINPKRVFLAFFTPTDEQYKLMTAEQLELINFSYPLINSSRGDRINANFSMLEGQTENGKPIIKIGGHFQRTAIEDLSKVWKIPLSRQEKAWGYRHTLNYLNYLGLTVDSLEFVKGYSCVYSLTESEKPYVTTIDATDNALVVVGGMSGVGAKGAMTYGLLASNLVLGNTETTPEYKMLEQELGYSRLQSDLEKLYSSK
ncbi:MAG: FAD-binding oxidoreductase [Cyclobacteriaceae bacterium]|nr:FAD-binding oxidoreductase [Cyclobacteriaceae bacterium]